MKLYSLMFATSQIQFYKLNKFPLKNHSFFLSSVLYVHLTIALIHWGKVKSLQLFLEKLINFFLNKLNTKNSEG